jgi:LmbE family N-acetylglucosaminyl deacetylase
LVLKSDIVLAVGAHPDDIELGCGGVIAAAAARGKRVIAVFLTKGEKSGDPETRALESRAALKILGVNEVYFGDFPDTEVPNGCKGIDFLEGIFESCKPKTVLTHTVHDVHQDHRQVAWLSMSAFRNATRLLAYETPRVTGEFQPSYFIDISNYVTDKWKALQCHMTQKSKRYLAYESMVHLSSFRGSQVNLPAAEAFEVIRYIESEP